MVRFLFMQTRHRSHRPPRSRGRRSLTLDGRREGESRCWCGRWHTLGGDGRRRGGGSSRSLDKVPNERLVLRDLASTDPLTLQLPQQSLPARIDIRTAEPLLRIESHMGDMREPTRRTNHTLVHSPSFLLLHRPGRGGRGLLGSGRRPCFLRVLVSQRDLLEELGRLGLGGERQSDHAFVSGEGVEERPVLEVRNILLDLMLPYDSSRTGQIHDLQPTSLGSPSKHYRTRDAAETPFRRVGKRIVDPPDSDGQDLVGGGRGWRMLLDEGFLRRGEGGSGGHDWEERMGFSWEQKRA